MRRIWPILSLTGCLVGVEAPSSVLAVGYGPAPAEGYVDVVMSAAGDDLCALHETGGVWCRSFDPLSGGPYASIAGGGIGDFCGVLEGSGELVCSGDAPIPPTGPHLQVAGAYGYWCAIDANDDIDCWTDGFDLYGETDPPSGDFEAIGLGDSGGCGIALDAGMSCWGEMDEGAPSGSFRAVDVGSDQGCAVRANGNLVCWGASFLTDLTEDVPSGEFVDVVVHKYTACALSELGLVSCWGKGDAVQTPTDDIVVAIATTEDLGCGVRPDRTITCWGDGPAAFP